MCGVVWLHSGSTWHGGPGSAWEVGAGGAAQKRHWRRTLKDGEGLATQANGAIPQA